jgi:S-(hydroxymethyl)glutathione dehydrogenase/alcohol dehydrogenase
MIELTGIVLKELGTLPTLETITMTNPGPNEVLVRMAASGICHTDIGYMQYARACPVLLGHEGAGVVEQVGDNVTHVRAGDHVVINWLPKCGECLWCRRGRQDLCENVRATDEPRVFWNGDPLNVMLSSGTFAPYVVIPGDGAVAVRKDMPLEKAALLGCAVATGVGAVLHTASLLPGEDVGVIGVGGVGLNVVQGARIANAGKIIAIDVDEEKLALARSLGATHTINSTLDDPAKKVKEHTNGRGVEYLFEVVGQPVLMQQGLEMLSRGGALILVGAADREALMEFHPRRFMSQQQRILGCIYGNISPHVDLPLLADWYMDGQLKLDELHTSTINIEDVPDVFADPRRLGGIRTVVSFDRGK